VWLAGYCSRIAIVHRRTRSDGSDTTVTQSKSPSDRGSEGLGVIDSDRLRSWGRGRSRSASSLCRSSWRGAFRSSSRSTTFGSCCWSSFVAGGRSSFVSCRSCRSWSGWGSCGLATNDQSQRQESQILLHLRSSENSASTGRHHGCCRTIESSQRHASSTGVTVGRDSARKNSRRKLPNSRELNQVTRF